MPLPKPDKKYTYADYLTWPAEKKMEIIDGIPYMQAAPSWQHQSISGELYRQISNYLVNKSCRVFAAPFDLCLVESGTSDEESDKVVQPDIVVICNESNLKKTGYFGVPTLIIEISSPATSRLDRVFKFNMYEKAGVKEYWIVDSDGKFINVFTLQANHRYGRPETYTEENQLPTSVFSDLLIDLEKVFAKI